MRVVSSPGVAGPATRLFCTFVSRTYLAQVRTLSPQSTLDRGYAIVQRADGAIVSDPADLEVGELLRVRVARGDFGARPVGVDET